MDVSVVSQYAWTPSEAKAAMSPYYYGSRKTVMRDRRNEIGAGLLTSMICQLGLDREDFR